MKNIKNINLRLKLLLLLIFTILVVTGCKANSYDNLLSLEEKNTKSSFNEIDILEGHSYSSKEDVSIYLITYDNLPPNFITKKEAIELGWDSKKGNLWDVSDMMSIGGDKFGNREGLLPQKEGRQYYECDIDYNGGFRGAKRLVYSNDGLIYYTEDHYNTFILIYGEE